MLVRMYTFQNPKVLANPTSPELLFFLTFSCFPIHAPATSGEKRKFRELSDEASTEGGTILKKPFQPTQLHVATPQAAPLQLTRATARTAFPSVSSSSLQVQLPSLLNSVGSLFGHLEQQCQRLKQNLTESEAQRKKVDQDLIAERNDNHILRQKIVRLHAMLQALP